LYSILYPVIGDPPLLVGADQKRLICVDETAVDTRLVGELGIVVVDVDFGWTITSDDDVLLVPNGVIA